MNKYHISYDNPLSHFVQIELTLQTRGEEQLELKLPVWRPGRYEILNFPKRIRNVIAIASDGSPLVCQKTSKNSWLVSGIQSEAIIVSYEYYAGLMDAGNSWLDDEQLYLNFINCMMYVESKMLEKCVVEFDLPENYQLATGLKKIGPHLIESPNYYQLVDSPLIASHDLKHLEFKNSGVKFHLWIQGELTVSEDTLLKDFQAYTTKQIEVMGGFPCQDYHYLFQIVDYKHYHGVEHWNSTVITIGPSDSFSERDGYLNLLGVSSHELFHTWNVISLRPKEMVPYDFERENYHQTGFVTEGVTTYYGDLFLKRSGVINRSEYIDELNKLLKRHYENEGRKHYSVAESSFDLWLDGYEPGIPGRKVSIYNEGALAALILDLMIRKDSSNSRSLDDVIRLIWQKYGADASGYSFQDYQEACEAIYESSLDDYFHEIILGTTPYEKYLGYLLSEFGFQFIEKPSDVFEERALGFRLKENKVISIASGSPAETHLMLGDEILRLNEKKFDQHFPTEPTVHLEIKRMGKTKEVFLSSDEQQFFAIYQIELKRELNDVERSLLNGWLELEV